MRHIRARTALRTSICLAALILVTPTAGAATEHAGTATAGSTTAAGPAPVNGRIAYVDLGDNGASFDVYTVRRDGRGVRRLTATGDAFSPRWAPQGRRIVFERNRVAAGTQLWTMGPRGGHKRLLLSGLRGGRFPSWSPNGRRIVFAADAARGTRQLFVLDLRTRHVHRLTHPGSSHWSADQPAWSPRGGRVAFIRYRPRGRPELYTVRLDGTRLHRLTRTTFTELDPEWSPDGSRIAYTRSRRELPCGSDVFIIDANGGTPAKVVDRGCDDSDPDWAPNGRRIVLYSNQRHGTPGWRRHSGLWTVRPDGSGLQMLLQGVFIGSPDWQAR